MPPMAKVLAEIGPHLARAIAPVVEQVAQRLAENQGTVATPLKVPTLLSQSNRSTGRNDVRTSAKKQARKANFSAPSACRECGVVLTKTVRHYCDECLPKHQKEQSASFSKAGRRRMAQLRAAGRDPSQTHEAREQRGAKNSQRMKEQKAWEADHGSDADPEVFTREIPSKLQGVSLGAMARATGLSQQYCSSIRRGLKVPHQRHWDELRAIPRPKVELDGW